MFRPLAAVRTNSKPQKLQSYDVNLVEFRESFKTLNIYKRGYNEAHLYLDQFVLKKTNQLILRRHLLIRRKPLIVNQEYKLSIFGKSHLGGIFRICRDKHDNFVKKSANLDENRNLAFFSNHHLTGKICHQWEKLSIQGKFCHSIHKFTQCIQTKPDEDTK